MTDIGQWNNLDKSEFMRYNTVFWRKETKDVWFERNTNRSEIKNTLELDFKEYICEHSNEKYVKENIISHIRNIEKLRIDDNTKRNIIGFETYCSKYEDFNEKSEIVFTIDKV